MIKTHVHPQIKLLTLTLRVTQKHAFSIHQINTPFVYHVSLSQKFDMPKRIVWAMLKKEKEKKNVHAKRHERKKIHAKEHEEKKIKKKRNKDNPYFQIKGFQ